MVTKKADYFYTDGLDRIEVDGSVLPLRTGAARKALKGEDLAFLAEALNERSLAASGYFALPTVGASQNFTYSRAEYEYQFHDIVSSFAHPIGGGGTSDSWLRTEYSALNSSTAIDGFLNPIDTSVFDSYGRLTGSKAYGPSRVEAIGATAYHHAPLTPSPLTAKIINVQDELDAYSNERKLTRFFREYNFDVGERLPPITVTATGVDDKGDPASYTARDTEQIPGMCIGFQYNWGRSTYHNEEDPITHEYVKSGMVWRGGFDDPFKVGARFYNLPPGGMGFVVIKILVVNRATALSTTPPSEIYVNRYFLGGSRMLGVFSTGFNPKSTTDILWHVIIDTARSIAPIWDSPFVHTDVTVPASRSQFDLMKGNTIDKWDCVEVYAQPIGAIIDLGDHTKWWTD